MVAMMGRTKWVCTVPGCSANPSKRNNIERHVWLQHVRKWQSIDMHEDYRVTQHKQFVEPYIRRYDGPTIITPPDTPPASEPVEPAPAAASAPATATGQKFKHERASSLGSRSIRTKPYDLHCNANQSESTTYSSYPNSSVSSPMLFSRSSPAPPPPLIHVDSPARPRADPLTFLARACEYQAHMDGLETEAVFPHANFSAVNSPHSLTPAATNTFDFRMSNEAHSPYGHTPSEHTSDASPSDMLSACYRPPELPRLVTWPGLGTSTPMDQGSPNPNMFAGLAVQSPLHPECPSSNEAGHVTGFASVASLPVSMHFNPYDDGLHMPPLPLDRPMSMDLSVCVQGGEDVWRPW